MESKSNSNWLTCKMSKARLSSIDTILESIIDSNNQEFRQLVLQTIRMGGKKLRPSLFLLSITFGEFYDKSLLFPAAALELLHTASLYHDDVMDRAELRRKSLSVNKLWGNINATKAGIYLFSKAISMLANSGKNINQITCRYISELCLGQLKEAENAYNLKLKKEDHIDIIREKTASLFELPCILGATLAGANQNVVAALARFSRNLGIAFQLVDDLLDLKGNPEKTGKTPGTDLKEGVYSYATLYGLNSKKYGAELSELLLIEDLTEQDITELIRVIETSGGIKAAKRKARFYANKAKDSIDFLQITPAKQSLISLADFIIARDH